MIPATRVHLVSRARPALSARAGFTAAEFAQQRAYFAAHPDLRATPLRRADALAASLGVGTLWLKDETERFGLPAFKGLGAGFAVAEGVREGSIPAGATLVCASEGNHGRAVARAAREHGLSCRVYVGARVAVARADAIASEGADVVRVSGTYDDAVRTAAADAARHGWHVISDTSWPGYEEIPRRIVLGYTRLMDECADAWGNEPPDIVLVQGGVGGLAAAVGSWFSFENQQGEARGATRGRMPHLVCVEPLEASCLLGSAEAGHPVPVRGPLATEMGGLRCGEVSPAAFAAVESTFDAYVAIDDEWARRAMRALAAPAGADARIACGPSGAAGVGALLALRDDLACAPLREALGVSAQSTVLALVTEGVTEPDLFTAIVGG